MSQEIVEIETHYYAVMRRVGNSQINLSPFFHNRQLAIDHKERLKHQFPNCFIGHWTFYDCPTNDLTDRGV